MTRIIAHLLQKTGYIALFFCLYYCLSITIDPGTCKRRSVGPMPMVALAMYALLLGYGAFLRIKGSPGNWSALWLAGAVVFGGNFLLGSGNTVPFESYRQSVLGTFVPEYRPGDLLESIGYFYQYVARFWMPFASGLSILAFIISFLAPARPFPAADDPPVGG